MAGDDPTTETNNNKASEKHTDPVVLAITSLPKDLIRFSYMHGSLMRRNANNINLNGGCSCSAKQDQQCIYSKYTWKN
eukprot:9841532-Ditylum_brightwellii.AAC.1